MGATTAPETVRHSRGTRARPRTRRIRLHRARNIWTALCVTTVCALLPGSGYVVAGRRWLGLLVALPHVFIGGGLLWYAATHARAVLKLAVDPDGLLLLTLILLVMLVIWVTVLVGTYRMLRPERPVPWQRYLGGVWVVALSLIVASPLVVGARYAIVQRDFINSIFTNSESATVPKASAANPWGDDDRVNVLLLGGDGGVNRVGIRTDSVMVASVDTTNGNTTLFSLPRNLEEVPFPEGSPLADVYPNGFTGEGDPLEWMLNAIYRNVPSQHPGILGNSDNEGADALKMGVSGALGIPIDYYVLINLDGFQKVVTAIGGITVNINDPIPIGGNSDQGIPPEDYLDPGPNQHLNGYEALWFARGRYGYDDYHRMERQRCVIDAIIDEAEPLNVLRRYKALADAGKEIVRTDVPQDLLPALLELALDVKDAKVKSVVFQTSEEFNSADPDYEWMHEKVQKAIGEGPKTPKKHAPGSGAPTQPQDELIEEPEDSCAYTAEG